LFKPIIENRLEEYEQIFHYFQIKIDVLSTLN